MLGMTNSISTRLVVLGSGPAGYTAAIYAARAGLSPVVIQGIQPGGQLTTTTDVENYPGFRNVIQGPWLMEEMQAQAEHVGTKVIWDHVSAVDLSRRPFRLTGDSGAQYFADTLVIATGAQAKWLGLPSEEHMKGRGASACATCDGFFYRGKKVAVIGGGNTAVEEALYLANIASHVTIVHRRDQFRSEKILADKLLEKSKHGNVTIAWNHVLEEVLGDNKEVTGARLRDVNTNNTQDIDVAGVFIAIGHDPNTQIFRGQVDMSESGYIYVKGGAEGNSTATNIKGVF